MRAWIFDDEAEVVEVFVEFHFWEKGFEFEGVLEAFGAFGVDDVVRGGFFFWWGEFWLLRGGYKGLGGGGLLWVVVGSSSLLKIWAMWGIMRYYE